ncbi:MAG: DUF4340 domain-containing protein [Clostridia bacterium]|nr:DUF4340 domain-containing protein [Clostridia bacterium]
MVPEKKPIDFNNDGQTEKEALEQTPTLTDETALEQPSADGESSTILTETNGMAKNSNKKVKPLSVRRFHTVIVLLAVVVSLVLGTVGVKLIPEKQDDPSATANNTISIKSTNTEYIEKIVVNGSHGEMVFRSKKNEAADSNSSDVFNTALYTWELEGYDQKLIASSSINAAADNLATIYATRIMENDLSKKESYGLTKPTITAKVFMREGKGEDYTFTVGDSAPDGSGYYACISGDSKIYLISAGTVSNFNKSAEEMANTVILNAPTVEEIVKKTDKKYFDEETGTLSSFDSIELSGPKYGKKVVITPVTDNELIDYSIDLGEYSRYADPNTVEEMFSLMTNGLVAIDTYALMPTAAQIKKYGLDSPELFITIKYGSLSTHLKASMYDEENQYYAVMINDRNAIYAVTADALAMLQYGVEDYYYQFVFQEFLDRFKNMTVKTPSKTYSFDIKHNSSDDTITATSNGQKIDDSLLSAYYQYFITLSPEVSQSYQDGEVALKATFTYKNTAKGKTVIELVKQTERRYAVRIDGNYLGIVTSADFDHLVVYAEYVMNNIGIPEP